MNLNQNFKNQLWALQSGNNYRVELEKEIANRNFGINDKFGDLIISTLLVDTIPEKVDTLLNYVLQNGTLNERMLTSPLFIEKERYMDAQSNLTEVSFMNETGNTELDISSCPGGLYFVRLITERGVREEKIVKE